MKDLPVLFKGPMVCAILEDRKLQTRRVPTRNNSFRDGIRATAERWNELDWQSPEIFVDDGPSPAGNPGPYLHVPDKDGDCSHRIYPQWRRGDRLWVRKTWVQWECPDHGLDPCKCVGYPALRFRADGDIPAVRWRPSIFMPRWASRILLEITDVRVQRMQDISEEDAMAEGMQPTGTLGRDFATARENFADLWDSLNAKRGFGWDANPWVWALTFKRVTETAE